MEDITKTGNQTYRDLQEENAGPYKKTTYDPNDFPKLTGKQAMRAYAPTEHTTSITDYAADLGYGESRFDKYAATPYQMENLQDVRGYNQPWYAQIGAGIAKGAVLAGTTFLDGTVGLIYGIGTSIADQRWSGLWDNEMSNTLNLVNQEMEKILPNYRTQEEQSKKWYQNLGTANFWGDSFLKNMGFTVGAFYSGSAWNGAFKALGILKRGITAQAVGSFLSAFNEGRIEASNGQREFLELENLKINDAYNKRRDEILNSNLSDTDKTTLLQHTADEAKLMYDEAKERAHVMGLTTLIGNTALLTFGNLIQFGKLYSRGFDTAKDLAGKTVRRNGLNNLELAAQQEASGVTREATEQGVRYGVNEITKGQAVARGLLNPLTEGHEEMAQKVIQTWAGNRVSNDDPDTYYKALIDPEHRDEMLKTNSALGKAIVSTWGNIDNWEEFAIGALTGALGMPTFGKVNNSSAETYLGKGKTIGLSGGIGGAIRGATDRNRQASEAADVMNKYMEKLAEKQNYFVQSSSYTDAMDGYAAENNRFEWNNYKDNDDFAAIEAFSRTGHLDDLRDMVNQDFENISDEELQNIALNTSSDVKLNPDGTVATTDDNGKVITGVWRNADGTLMSSTEEGRTKMREELAKKRDNILKGIDEYEKSVTRVRGIANGSLDESQIQELAWLNWKGQRFKERYDSISDRYKDFITNAITSLDESIKDINRISEIEEELKQHDGETRTAWNNRLRGRRKELNREKKQLLNKGGINGLDLTSDVGQSIFKNIEYLSQYFSLLQSVDNPEKLGRILESSKDVLDALQDEGFSTVIKEALGKNDSEYKEAIDDLIDLSKIGIAAKSFSERYEEFINNPLSQQKNREKLDDEAQNKEALKDTVRTSSEIDSMEVNDIAQVIKDGKQISEEVMDKLDPAAKEKIRKAQEMVDAYTQRVKDIQEAEVSPEVRAAATAQVEEAFKNSKSKKELLNLEAAAYVDDLLVANTIYDDGQAITQERQEAVEKILNEANELQRNLNIQDEKRSNTKIPENVDKIIEEAQKAEVEDAPSAGNDANAENDSDEASFKAEQEELDDNKVETVKNNILDDFENAYAIELNLKLDAASKQTLLNNLKQVVNQVENLAQQGYSFIDIVNELNKTPQGFSILPYLNNPAYRGTTLEELYDVAKNTKEEAKKPKSEKIAEVEKEPEEYLPVIDEDESESETQKENNFYSTTKDPDDKPKGKDPYQYWRSNTPEYVYIYVDGEKVNGKVERKRVPIKYNVYLQGKSEEEVPYKNRDLEVYDYFVKNGVFERRNSGGIKEGNTIYYITDPELNKKAGEVVILMALKNDENKYDVIGDVGSKLTNTGSQIGLIDFILRFEDAYSKAGDTSQKWVYKDETTTIKKILVGTGLYTADDNTLNTIFGDNDFEIGIIADSTTHQVKMSPNKTISNKERSILAPLSGKRGQTVVLIPTNNNGKRKAYITVRFTPQRFDIEKHKNTQYYKALEQAITNAVKAKSFKIGGNTAKDALMDLLSLPDNLSLTWKNGKLSSFVLHSSDETKKVQLINKGDRFNSDEELVQHLMEQISNADILIQVSNKYINNNRPFKIGNETINYNRMIGEISTANLGNNGHIVNNWFFSSYKEEKDGEELFDPSQSPSLEYNDVETAHGKRTTREEPISDKKKPKPVTKPKPETRRESSEAASKKEENTEVIDEISEGIKSGKISTRKNKERTAEESNVEFEKLFAGKKARQVWDKLSLAQQNKILNISDMSQQQSCMSTLSSAVAPKGFIPSKLGNKSVDEIIDSFDVDANRKDIGHLRKVDTTHQERADLLREKRIIEKSLPQLNRKEIIRIHKGLLKISNSDNPLYAWGKFQDGIITLSDKAARGTLYHESFHFVFNSLLTDDEIVKIYDAAKEIYGDKSYLALEEDLAEDFRRYMQFQEELEIAKESGNIQEWNRIKSEIKSLLNKLNGKTHILNNLFSDIYNRKYAERVVNNRNAAQTTIEREMQDIRQDAIARGDIVLKPDGTFDYAKAPNGNRSNLTERQWLQVRTRAFKRWFGDWEHNAKLTSIIESDDFEFIFEDVPNANLKIGSVVNAKNNLNNLCLYTRSKAIAHLNKLGFKHVSAIGGLRAKSPVMDKTIIHHAAILNIGGKLYLYDMPQTEFITPTDKTFGDKNQYKEAIITSNFKPRFIELTVDNLVNIYGDTKDHAEWLVNDQYENNYEDNLVNASKVVDENGEPLQVYHHTDNPNLTEFSIEHPNYFSQRDNGTKKAIFFDENPTGTLNRKYDIPVFLNIRDLHTYNLTKEQLHQQGSSYTALVNKSAEQNDRTGGVHMEHFDDNKMTDQDVWVVHNPNQIKSATDNIGTFSEDDNIRYRKTVSGDMSNVYEDKLEAYESNKLSYEELSEEDKDLLKDVGIDESSWLELTKEEKENTKRCLL